MGVVRALRDSTGEETKDKGPPIPSNAVLVEAALAGETWAHEALFRRHARMAAGLGHRLTIGSGIDVDDLVQDSFVTAFEKLPSLREPDAFSSWLGSIVVRTASKRIRRHKLRVRLGMSRNEPIDLDLIVSNTASPDTAVLLRQIYGILVRLKPDERIAFLLRRVEGLTVAEVAERMDSSLSTVKRRLAAAEGRFEREVARRPFGDGATSDPTDNIPGPSSKQERRSHHD